MLSLFHMSSFLSLDTVQSNFIHAGQKKKKSTKKLITKEKIHLSTYHIESGRIRHFYILFSFVALCFYIERWLYLICRYFKQVQICQRASTTKC